MILLLVVEVIPVYAFGVVWVQAFAVTHVCVIEVFPRLVVVVFPDQVSFVTVVPVVTRISLTCS